MHMTKIKIALLILCVTIVTFLAWVALTPRNGRPNVAINVLSYANDSSGARLATIGITNLSEFTVLVYRPTIQLRAATEWGGFTNYFADNTNQWRSFHSKLGRGESGSFVIPLPPPAYQSPWRLSFVAYADFEAVQVMKNIFTGPRYRFGIESDWMDNDK